MAATWLDAAIGLALPVVTVAVVTVRVTGAAARPLVTVVLRPPLVPTRWQPGRFVEGVAAQGRSRRRDLALRTSAALDQVVPPAADAVLQRVDLDSLLGRIDLAGMAQEVVVTMDLPELIREATAAASSESVRVVRMRGIAGDAVVGRMADRLRGRHRGPAAAAGPPLAAEQPER